MSDQGERIAALEAEIARLRIVIDSYARSSKAAAQELAMLRGERASAYADAQPD